MSFYWWMPGVVVFVNKVVKNVNVFVCVVCCEILEHFFFHHSVPAFNHRRFLIIFSKVQHPTLSHYYKIISLCLSKAFVVFSVWKFLFVAFETETQALSFNGSIQTHFENTSITVRRYLTPRLDLENDCMSTRSVTQILSILFTYTFRFQNSWQLVYETHRLVVQSKLCIFLAPFRNISLS